jgi:lysozyme-like protein
MIKYSVEQMESLAVTEGFAAENARVMAAIAEAESSGNPHATNRNRNGSVDYGLTQINTIHDVHFGEGWARQALNPHKAFAHAHVIWKQAGGFHPWTTYNNGAYKLYL